MNWWNRNIDKLIYEKDKQDPEAYLKGKFFVGSTMVFVVLCVSAIPYFLIFMPEMLVEHPEIGIGNSVTSLMLLGVFWLYKKFGYRVAIVNSITVVGYGGNYATYDLNGGIYSPDCIWGIIISCWVFLVANKASGYFWMALTVVTQTFFYYAEIRGYNDFLQDVIKLGSQYFYFNYLLAAGFLLAIISLYETSKRKFVNELKTSKSEVEVQKKALEVQKEDILSSIQYAKRIQYAVLPNEESIYRSIPLSFILYRPRDIVSGDFFWFHEIDRDNYIIACADCTGHGVPGAFMTVIGSSLLNQIVTEGGVTAPSEILSELDRRITVTLKQQKEHYQVVQDGMDLALLKVNKAKKEFVFTSAKRPAIFIRGKEIQEIKGSKNTLGGLRSGEKKFAEIAVNYQEDDMLYLFTDGYIDQFGGPDNKKFMIKRFRELLLSVHMLPVAEQKQKVGDTIASWIGSNEQTDDITVMGIRF